MGQDIEALPDGITAIDTRTAGLRSVTAGYLIDAPRPTLVECGPALSVHHVVEGLQALGMDPGDLAYLVLSHIHLDHAGGAGTVAEAFPSATIVVSEIGAPHLVDPSRLNASSRRVYGDLMDTVYGECTPIPAARLRGVVDGESLDLGAGRRLELLYTPGHAKHHIAAYEPDAGALFVGDSVGVRMPGMQAIRPATPPPDFDLVLATRTLSRYQDIAPQRVYLAHYGPVDPPQQALAEAEEQLRRWFEAAEGAWREHREIDHVAETLAQRFGDPLRPGTDDHDDGGGDRDGEEDEVDEARRRVSLLAGIRSNAQGLYRYLNMREEGRTAT